MIRLSWRQFRMQAGVAFGVLVALAVVLAATRPHLAHLYDVFAKAQAACVSSGNCRDVGIKIGTLDRLLELVATGLVAVPALVGAFWGAPLIAREFEAGTHRLAWTQSVTRTRWLAAKLAVVGLESIAVSGLLSLLVTWWSAPADRVHTNRFGAGTFGQRNIVPLGYAAFGFALGIVAGLLIRRTLPAMATTLAAFLAVRIVFTLFVRQHLISPVHKALPLDPGSMGFGSTNSGPSTLMPNPPNLPNAWIYSTHIVNNTTGHGLTAQFVNATCPSLGIPTGGPPPVPGTRIRIAVPAGAKNALEDCVTKIGATYHEVVTYQPANRYWTFQWYETAIYLAAALVLAGFSFWWIPRRAK
jgi:ABC-type transport system involved in multi-copper enzyme maturation permease subunit